MARAPIMQIDGAKELRRTLKKAGDDLGDLKAAHAAVGGVVSTAARGTVPVRTGRLGGTIRAAKMVGGATVRAGSAAVPYAGVIHWGYPARNIEAQPFLTDAAQSTEPEWVALYEREIDRILASVKGKE